MNVIVNTLSLSWTGFVWPSLAEVARGLILREEEEEEEEGDAGTALWNPKGRKTSKGSLSQRFQTATSIRSDATGDWTEGDEEEEEEEEEEE